METCFFWLSLRVVAATNSNEALEERTFSKSRWSNQTWGQVSAYRVSGSLGWVYSGGILGSRVPCGSRKLDGNQDPEGESPTNDELVVWVPVVWIPRISIWKGLFLRGIPEIHRNPKPPTHPKPPINHKLRFTGSPKKKWSMPTFRLLGCPAGT